MKSFVIAISCFIQLINVSTTTDIDCHISQSSGSISKLYCFIIENPNINSREDAANCKLTGHNENVTAIGAQGKVIKYFPQIFTKNFKNLNTLNLFDCQMKEIRQSDLKNFPLLSEINLHINEIEELEEGLFDFNPLLEWINLYSNKISYIHIDVFDNLVNLSKLWLDKNNCISIYTYDIAVMQVIHYVKEHCSGITSEVETTELVMPITDAVGEKCPENCAEYCQQVKALNEENGTLRTRNVELMEIIRKFNDLVKEFF